MSSFLDTLSEACGFAPTIKGVLRSRKTSANVRMTISLIVGSVIGVWTTMSAHGAVVVYIDLDPATSGIQSSAEVFAGQSLVAEIRVELTGESSVSTYGISVQFDTFELDLDPVGASATEFLPVGFTTNLSPGVTSESEDIGGGLGQISTFEAFAVGDGPAANGGSVSFVIGSINFRVGASDGADSDIDITPGFYVQGVDAMFDNDNAPVSPTFIGADVTFVPEPSGLVVILGSLCFVAGRSKLVSRKRGIRHCTDARV